jgi:hypothetical protein
MSGFKPIVGYEGSYAINRKGIVMSLTRSINIDYEQIAQVKQCRMHSWINSSNEECVQLSRKSQRQIHTIQSLIQEAFGDKSE